MRLGFKTRQVLGVTFIVAICVVTLSAIHLTAQARTLLAETELRGKMLANSTFQRAFRIVRSGETAQYDLQADEGLRTILQSAIGYAENVTYATITDVRNRALVHSSPTLEGTVIPEQPELEQLLAGGPIAQIVGVWEQRSYEVTQPLLLGDERFGSIRIGVSTVLIWDALEQALKPLIGVAALAIVLATAFSWLLAQRFLRPIHVLQSGITRLGQGEQDVTLDLPGDEFKDLGSSFNALSQSVSSIRGQLVEQARRAESVVERLEDAVAVFSPAGEVVFVNAAMKRLLSALEEGASLALVPPTHACRILTEQVLSAHESAGPILADRVDAAEDANQQQWMAHPMEDPARGFVGVMLVARNVGALSQVQSTLRYSRKLASLNRLLAGVAHEVKNPLNAMTIHLELLRQKLQATVRVPASVSSGGSTGPGEGTTTLPALMTHVGIIGDEIRRLDQVVQGFLRFSRPEELQLEPVAVKPLLADVADVVRPQAAHAGTQVVTDVQGVVDVQADRPMLRQALLNLALNAIQAMPEGGTLTLASRPVDEGFVEVSVTDTGVGIAPDHLARVFDLYFTTREEGSGLGLSMVYRAVQLHDGTIEVESSPGQGASFRMRLPQA
jgi:signal transduction histidine kinase